LKERLDDYILPKALPALIDRAAIAGALYHLKETAQVTLNSIGDAVVCIGVERRATYLNATPNGSRGRHARKAPIGCPRPSFISSRRKPERPSRVRRRWRPQRAGLWACRYAR
jgi:hypothetical protein